MRRQGNAVANCQQEIKDKAEREEAASSSRGNMIWHARKHLTRLRCFIFVWSSVKIEERYLSLIHASDNPANLSMLRPLKPVFFSCRREPSCGHPVAEAALLQVEHPVLRHKSSSSSEKSRRRLLGIRWNSPSSGLGSHPSSHLPGLADRCAAPVTPVTKHLGNTRTRDQPYRPGRCWYSAHRYISF